LGDGATMEKKPGSTGIQRKSGEGGRGNGPRRSCGRGKEKSKPPGKKGSYWATSPTSALKGGPLGEKKKKERTF